MRLAATMAPAGNLHVRNVMAILVIGLLGKSFNFAFVKELKYEESARFAVGHRDLWIGADRSAVCVC